MKFSVGLLPMAFCSIACAMTLPRAFPPGHVDKVIDAADYMAGIQSNGTLAVGATRSHCTSTDGSKIRNVATKW